MSFYIKNKATGEFFKGFDETGEVLWSDTNEAKPYETKLLATCQSTLLTRFGHPAQMKPVYG